MSEIEIKEWLVSDDEVVLKSEDELDDSQFINVRDEQKEYKLVISEVEGSSDLYVGRVFKSKKISEIDKDS